MDLVFLRIVKQVKVKKIKCYAMLSTLLLFGNEFNTFNNSGLQALDFNNQMTLTFKSVARTLKKSYAYQAVIFFNCVPFQNRTFP